MKDVLDMKGRIRFPVKGQDERPAWERKILYNEINGGHGAPKDLRYQCRIAMDAREVFSSVPVEGGTLTLHDKSKPQFGRDKNGKPYLTVVLVDSRDGESYMVRWIGDAVPKKMVQVAVKHDQGKRVEPTIVGLRWEDAEIRRSEHKSRPRHDLDGEGKTKVRPNGRTGGPKKPLRYGRMCAEDLAVT
jgi:hypothetical protein